MKKRFRKVYVEISNICNLKCQFCPGTKREPRIMSEEEFSLVLQKLKPWTDYLYFHLMGEPLAHPQLGRFLQLAGEAEFKVILTTNGTLLHKWFKVLLASPALHKVNISLHAYEANNMVMSFQTYIDMCVSFGIAAHHNMIVVYRLWNRGGRDSRNLSITSALKKAFPQRWKFDGKNTRITERTFLEYGNKFDWPDLSAEDGGTSLFCYGLRDQIGILCDGTVVPCCLDHEGDIPLGNLFNEELDDILQSPRAKAIYDGFSQKTAVEELCRKCGYARRFS